jgi:hypothetical protein
MRYHVSPILLARTRKAVVFSPRLAEEIVNKMSEGISCHTYLLATVDEFVDEHGLAVLRLV